MRMMGNAFLVLAALGTSAQAVPDRYAPGQVWEYRTRAPDAGSLVKIQRVEDVDGGASGERVYHISIVGVRLANAHLSPVLPHVPVSQQTLDASVTRRASGAADFPPLSTVDEGIQSWRQARGGVFTISLAQIVDLIDQQTRDVPPPPGD